MVGPQEEPVEVIAHTKTSSALASSRSSSARRQFQATRLKSIGWLISDQGTGSPVPTRSKPVTSGIESVS